MKYATVNLSVPGTKYLACYQDTYDKGDVHDRCFHIYVYYWNIDSAGSQVGCAFQVDFYSHANIWDGPVGTLYRKDSVIGTLSDSYNFTTYGRTDTWSNVMSYRDASHPIVADGNGKVSATVEVWMTGSNATWGDDEVFNGNVEDDQHYTLTLNFPDASFSHTLYYYGNGGTGTPPSQTVTNPYSNTFQVTLSSTRPTIFSFIVFSSVFFDGANAACISWAETTCLKPSEQSI